MNDVFLRCINMALVAIEFFAFIVLANGFFSFKRSRLQVLLICIVGFLTNYILLVVFESFILLKLLALSASLAVILRVICRVRIINCLVTSILYISIVNVLDGTILYIVAAVTRVELDIFLNNPYRYYLLAFFSKIIELLIITIIRAWAKDRFYQRTPSPVAYLRICIFPLTVLISAVILLNSSIHWPDAAPDLLMCVSVLLIADIASILLLNQFEEQQQTLLETRVLQQELKLSQDHITSLADSYAHERKLTHDFQNRLAVIQGLLQKENAGQETLAYVDEIIEQETVSTLAITTNRTVADVVLTQKYLLASQKRINFSVQADDLSLFPLPDDALVVVLANLLDNAIEACEQITACENRRISVKAQHFPEEWLLYVENTVAAPVKIERGRMRSTKTDPQHHGFGLQNVFAIIKKYNGTYAIGCTDLRFSFVIHFIFDK